MICPFVLSLYKIRHICFLMIMLKALIFMLLMLHLDQNLSSNKLLKPSSIVSQNFKKKELLIIDKDCLVSSSLFFDKVLFLINHSVTLLETIETYSFVKGNFLLPYVIWLTIVKAHCFCQLMNFHFFEIDLNLLGNFT